MLKTIICTALALMVLCVNAAHAPADEAGRERFSAPDTVSRELRELIASDPPPYWNQRPENTQEWKAFVSSFVDAVAPMLPVLREKMDVTVVTGETWPEYPYSS